MTRYEKMGSEIRELSKELVLEYMNANVSCWPGYEGLTQAEIFRSCGLDWGDKQKARSSQQQYWISALLRSLAEKGLVERIETTGDRGGPWRLTPKGRAKQKS